MGDIYAICKTLNAGTDKDKEKVLKHNIKVGDKFLLTNAEVGGWHTDVYFNEFPNVSFNSVFFTFEDEDGEFVNIYDMEEFRI